MQHPGQDDKLGEKRKENLWNPGSPRKRHAKIMFGNFTTDRLYFFLRGRFRTFESSKIGLAIILNCRLQQFLCFFELRSSTSFRVGGRSDGFFRLAKKSR